MNCSNSIFKVSAKKVKPDFVTPYKPAPGIPLYPAGEETNITCPFFFSFIKLIIVGRQFMTPVKLISITFFAFKADISFKEPGL